MRRIAISTAVLTIVILVFSATTSNALAQPLFVDGFESAGLCSWDSEALTNCNVGNMLTVTLPGGVTLTVSYVPAGTYLMGSPETERGRGEIETEDLHPVSLTSGYYMGIYSVTQSQWEAIVPTPMPTFCGDSGIGPDNPVYCVSWDEIAGTGGFFDLLNAHLTATSQAGAGMFRLPTEAEWERAARAGTQARFSHGDGLECGDFNEPCSTHDLYMWWGGNYSAPGNHPVGSKLHNDFFLYDMHGNTFDWVQDWWQDRLGYNEATDPNGPDNGTAKVSRGGFWSFYASICRSAYRKSHSSDYHSNTIGFRVARSQ